MTRFLLIAILFLPMVHHGQTSKIKQEAPLKVGYAYTPPYLFTAGGEVSGMCYELWTMVADSLDIKYELVYYATPDSLIRDLRMGVIDLSICPYTATQERLRDHRLTIPFFISNMGILSRADDNRPLVTFISHLFSWTVIRWFLLILAVVTVFAIFLWLAERRANSVQFHPGIRGIFDGIWWAFVTMTTVGYGDKTPKSILGRVLAIAWMFFAIGLFFVASGVVSSELTLNKLRSKVSNSDDLIHVRVASVRGSGYSETLLEHGVKPVLFSSVENALLALDNDSIDAFVADEAILKYIIVNREKGKKLSAIRSGLNLQYFSFLTSRENHDLVEQINPALLSIIDSKAWQEILERYGLVQ